MWRGWQTPHHSFTRYFWKPEGRFDVFWVALMAAVLRKTGWSLHRPVLFCWSFRPYPHGVRYVLPLSPEIFGSFAEILVSPQTLHQHLSPSVPVLWWVRNFSVALPSLKPSGYEKGQSGNFPGSSVVKTPHAWCKGLLFDPWSGTKIPHALWCSQKFF